MVLEGNPEVGRARSQSFHRPDYEVMTFHHLAQKLANFFCKGPDSTYFRLCRPCGCYCSTQLCSSSMKAVTDDTERNGQGWVPVKR